MKCDKCEYSCGCIETCKLKSSECYKNQKNKMNTIRQKAIEFEAEMYGVATNVFVDGFVNGYEQGRAEAIDKFAEMMRNLNTLNCFVDYVADEIDLEELMKYASEEIAEQMKEVTE